MDDVQASSGQEFQVNADLITIANGLEVGAHPCLIGDDSGIFRVCLSITAVGRSRMVNDSARNIEQLLAVIDQ